MAQYESEHTGAMIDATISAVIAGQAGIQGIKVGGEEITPDEENKVSLSIPNVQQSTGTSTTDVMSQKAVTDSLDLKASFEKYTATLDSNDWVGTEAPYTQTLSVSGILATDSPIVDVSEVTSDILTAWECVSGISTSNGSITATCLSEKPVSDIPIQLLTIR